MQRQSARAVIKKRSEKKEEEEEAPPRHSIERMRLRWLILVCGASCAAVKYDRTVLTPWPCPTGGTVPCWITSESDKTIADFLSHSWDSNCSYCPDLTRCSYSTVPVPGQGCPGCNAPSMQAQHRICAPLALNHSMCWPPDRVNCGTAPLTSSMCDKGFYGGTSALNGFTCSACLSISVQCGAGFFPKQCPTDDDDAAFNAGLLPNPLCVPCTIPALTTTTTMRYDAGFTFTDCKVTAVPSLGYGASFDTCAFFQTPKWGLGYCRVVCAAGYATTALPPYEVGLPTCAACATACAPGFYPPYCPGGPAAAAQSPECVPCDARLLPHNANWTASAGAGGSNCAWECTTVGYYAPPALMDCVPCPPPPAQACPPLLQRWMGCAQASSGGCVPCALRCTAGVTFLRAEVYMATCACAACAAPVPGQTFVLRNCTNTSDAVLQPCSACLRPTHYQSVPCTPLADTRCQPCTPPAPRLLLLSPCTALADARYGRCPYGLACDGSATPYPCPPPWLPDQNGSCLCPPATAPAPAQPGVCAPIACPSSPASFPDPTTGGCSPCTGDASVVRSRPGVLGPAACGCAEGNLAFREGAAVTCWPCGDLGCAAGLQRQVPFPSCTGFTSVEPTCQCGAGPGTVVLPPEDGALDAPLCAVQCAPGFVPAQPDAPALARGLWDAFFFLSLPTTTIVTAAAGPLLPCARVVRLVPFGAKAFLGLCGDNGRVFALPAAAPNNNNNASAAAPAFGFAWTTVVDVLGTLFTSALRSGVVARDLVPHGTDASLVWILFTFSGLCGDNLDTGQWSASCTAVELLYASETATDSVCDQGAPVCWQHASLSWGNAFQGGGLAGAGEAVTWGPVPGCAEGALYLVVDAALFQYNLTFYSPLFPFASRAPDPCVRLLAVVGAATTTALAAAMDGLYLVLASASLQRVVCGAGGAGCAVQPLRFNWSVATPITGLAGAPGGAAHILHVHCCCEASHYTVDLWNGVVSAPQPGGAHGTTMVWSLGLPLIGLGTAALYRYPGAAPCAVDTYYANGETHPAQCLRETPCGPHSTRAPGANVCGCDPGFYFVLLLQQQQEASSSSSCQPCPPSFAGVCPGGQSPPVRCPPHSTVAAGGGARASLSSDCLCLPGYLLFQGACVRCPTSLVCPFNGTIAPLPCYGNGYTYGDGALSPLECVCPDRTHGIACEPCGDRMYCTDSPASTPYYSALHVAGLGPLDGDLILLMCVDLLYLNSSAGAGAAPFFIQNALGVSAATLAGQSQSLLAWDWIVVVPGDAGAAVAHLGRCIGPEFVALTALTAIADSVPMRALRVQKACGGPHWRWDAANGDCGCVPGY